MIKATKYIAAVMIAAATAACMSEADGPSVQPSPDKYICFGVPTIKVNATVGSFADTPASRASSSLTSSIGKFQVWAFCVPNDLSGNLNDNAVTQEWNYKSTFFTGGVGRDHGADVFDALVVTNNDNGYTSYDINSAQANNQYQKWNDNAQARYAFIAGYIPEGVGDFKGSFSMEKALQTTETGSDVKNKSHGPRLTYTLPHAATIDTVGFTEIVPSNDLDALIAARFDHQLADGRVNLSFFHFMTGLRFKFHNHTTDKQLVITRVIYKGIFHRQITFDFTKDEPTMSVTGEYGRKFQLYAGAQTIAPGTADFMGSDDPVIFLMLPNPEGTTNDSDDKYTLGRDKEIIVEYTLGDGEVKHFIHKNFTLNYIPQPNTLHTAHFNFVGDDFVVFFQADDEKNWENGSDNSVIIQ